MNYENLKDNFCDYTKFDEFNTNENEMVDWIYPEHPKKKIRKAGEVLKGEFHLDINYTLAEEIMSNWRGSHIFPLNTVQNCVRNLAKSISDNYVVAQRLKRKASIIGKLNRFPSMSLDRMQDIGGCRIILPDIVDVETLTKKIENNETLNIKSKKDYLANPKESGYRSIHLISKYSGRNENYINLQVEIQIRTEIQHYWATAIELIDTFANENLKIGQGSNDWNTFFQNVSILFENIEHNITPSDTLINTIKELENQTNALYNLVTYSLVANVTEELKKKRGLFLLILDEGSRIVNLKHFKKNELKKAMEIYKVEENIIQNNVVLVDAQSVNELRKSYPNYFGDSELFSKLLRKYIKDNENESPIVSLKSFNPQSP